ncbi:MAG: signal peptidase I, partial [Ruminococcus sp.]|nr:signal peptidase I [Ruminococcus sp.]
YVMINAARGKAVSVFGNYVLRVMTGSMEPSIHVDDYIIVRKTEVSKLKAGDVISFYSEDGDAAGKLVTHRIMALNKDGTFVTKGDANEAADNKSIRPDQIVGKYIRKSRFFKWINSFANAKKLLLVLVIIPLTIVALYEVRTVTKLGIEARLEDKQEYEAKKQELIREAIEKEKQRLAEEAAANADKENKNEPREDNEEKDG